MTKAAAQPEWQVHPSAGFKYRRDPDKPTHGFFLCPDCHEPEERHRGLPNEGTVSFGRLTGRCGPRGQKSRQKLKGKRRHSSGADFLFDKMDGIKDRNVYVWIICPNPDKNPGCKGEYMGYKFQWYRRDASCLCPRCVELPGRGHTSRLITDGKVTVRAWPKGGAAEGPPIAEVRYGPGRQLAVEYLLEACRHTEKEEDWTRENLKARLSSHKKGKRPGDHFPLGCAACRRDPVRKAQLLLSVHAIGDGQKNGGCREARAWAHSDTG